MWVRKNLPDPVYSCIINTSTNYGFNIPASGACKRHVHSLEPGVSAFNIPVFVLKSSEN